MEFDFDSTLVTLIVSFTPFIDWFIDLLFVDFKFKNNNASQFINQSLFSGIFDSISLVFISLIFSIKILIKEIAVNEKRVDDFIALNCFEKSAKSFNNYKSINN